MFRQPIPCLQNRSVCYIRMVMNQKWKQVRRKMEKILAPSIDYQQELANKENAPSFWKNCKPIAPPSPLERVGERLIVYF